MNLDQVMYMIPGAAILGIYYFFWLRRGSDDEEGAPTYGGEFNDEQQYRSENRDALYHADRKDPVKAWFHGVYALQYGLKSDPGYWSPEEAEAHLTEAWGFEDVESTLDSLEWYLEEPINPAYDMVRSIIVARNCLAAGWLSEEKSDLICNLAQLRILELVGDWEELAQEITAGRLVVFKGKLPRGRKKRDQSNLDFGRKHVFGRVAFRVQPPELIPQDAQAQQW